MKLKGNGGYQIIDFEGQAPNTLDVDFFGNTIARGKPLWVNNLVVDGENYSGVASAKKTATAIILVLATITITILLADGSATYEEIGGGDCNAICVEITSQSTSLSNDELNAIKNGIIEGKCVFVNSNKSYDEKEEAITYDDLNIYSPIFATVLENVFYNLLYRQYTVDGDVWYSIDTTTGAVTKL